MTTTPAMTKQKALMTVRLIWLAMLLSPILAFVVLMFIVKPSPSNDASLNQILHMVSLVFTLVLIPIGYIVRLQIYKKNWVVNSVTPQGYAGGNIVLLGICEGAALLGVVVTFLAGVVMPYILPAFVAVLTQIINWPNGRAMEPAEMDLSRR